MNERVPFLDLRIRDDLERVTLLSSIERVFLHGQLINGPEVVELENLIAKFCGRKYAVGVNSGSDALFLALKSLGIGPGDEVITTSLSWIATSNAIALTGASPVFADIGNDLNIDPESVKRLISGQTKAILPVHYTGRICDMMAFQEIADKNDLLIIEDVAQAFGAKKYGKMAGSFGKVACFSMNPMKVFASCGEAGMILTDDEKLYERLLALRYNGTVNKEVCIEPGLNGRLDTIQAAILLERFKLLPEIIRKRREIALWYNDLLYGVVGLPLERREEYNVYYTYTIQADRRDELKTFLESRGIETKIQHPILMPEQPAYKGKAKGNFSNARSLVQRILCIPANEKLTREQVEFTAENIKAFYRS